MFSLMKASRVDACLRQGIVVAWWQCKIRLARISHRKGAYVDLSLEMEIKTSQEVYSNYSSK